MLDVEDNEGNGWLQDNGPGSAGIYLGGDNITCRL